MPKLICRTAARPGAGSTAARALALLTLAAAWACAGTAVKDPSQYTEVPMNKVYPYPSDDELAERTHRVSIQGRIEAEVDPARAQATQDLIRLRVEDILALAGASLVADDGSEFAPDRPARRLDLVVRIDREDYSVTWKDPTNWLFQSEEEMAQKPGTCTHKAEIEVVFSVVDPAHPDGRPAERFTLRHAGESESKTLDQQCPLAEAEIQGLFDTVVDEALACARIPLQNAFAARGHVRKQRKRASDDQHLFKTSLGAGQGAAESVDVAVFRVQYSTGVDGTRVSEEHRIATGRFTDQIQPDSSWIRVDVGKAKQTLLNGDVVRPIYRESATADLNPFGGCSDILSRP
ncbi:MAG: hypothetical protein ACQGVK_08010 [Myxococcota bacterium]